MRGLGIFLGNHAVTARCRGLPQAAGAGEMRMEKSAAESRRMATGFTARKARSVFAMQEIGESRFLGSGEVRDFRRGSGAPPPDDDEERQCAEKQHGGGQAPQERRAPREP